ncbi:MAG: dihydroorotate dehydrogenase-like protein [Bacteroidales bacterium]|jgi:dihydroorotate dehydrogenase (fumarate)|nr:dihydroorotate dehydrogenase-like protein [Bacteroidales bacterium]
MVDLSVKYMGMSLPSPLILGSCSLSNTVKNLQEAEKAGFGAIVLKSVFEEEIKTEIASSFQQVDTHAHAQAIDYVSRYQEIACLEKHAKQVREACQAVNIPIIASINCFSAEGWTSYAKMLEEAGANALEINYFLLPSDFDKTADEYTAPCFKLVENLKKEIKIPVALKTSFYFTDLARIMQKLSYAGWDALVLFNRFYLPDIDLKNMKFFLSGHLSTPDDLLNTLRWVGLLSEHLTCDIAATTGCHDANGLIKLLLAGADSVQAASVFYQKGLSYASEMLNELKKWMEENEYQSIDAFKAKMNYTRVENPAAYFRVQFMKYVSEL